jgi:nucleoside-diphosphate-sugar epimerase
VLVAAKEANVSRVVYAPSLSVYGSPGLPKHEDRTASRFALRGYQAG